MKILLTFAIVLTMSQAFADELPKKINVTCWNATGVQILKVKAKAIYSSGDNSTSNINIFVDSENKSAPDYVLFNGSCITKKLSL